jgi:hypothetical protein
MPTIGDKYVNATLKFANLLSTRDSSEVYPRAASREASVAWSWVWFEDICRSLRG